MTENNLVYKETKQSRFDHNLDVCLNELSGAKVEKKNGAYMHITLNSFIFGFIDDMYLSYRYVDGDVIYLTAQSQLRMGSDDFNKNYDHVKTFLDCLDEKYPPNQENNFPLPCSQPGPWTTLI